MKKLFLLAAILMTVNVIAVNAQETKIGVVDVDFLVANSQKGRAITGELDKLKKQKQSEGEIKANEIRRLQQDLRDNSGSMTQDQRNRASQEIESKIRLLRQFQDDATREVQKLQESMLRSFDKEVTPIIDQIARQKNLDAVFRKFESGLLYLNPRLDITDDVIRALDTAR